VKGSVIWISLLAGSDSFPKIYSIGCEAKYPGVYARVASAVRINASLLRLHNDYRTTSLIITNQQALQIVLFYEQFPWIKKTTCDTNSASRPSFCGSANNAALDSCANSNQARLEIEVSADSYSEADNSFKVLMRKNGKFDVERVSVENLSNNQVVRMSRCLNKDKCYKFIMLDKFGDGICCGYGKGYYIITWDGK